MIHKSGTQGSIKWKWDGFILLCIARKTQAKSCKSASWHKNRGDKWKLQRVLFMDANKFCTSTTHFLILLKLEHKDFARKTFAKKCCKMVWCRGAAFIFITCCVCCSLIQIHHSTMVFSVLVVHCDKIFQSSCILIIVMIVTSY